MIVPWIRCFRRTSTVAGTVVAAVVAFGTPAQAHEAMLLDRTDVVPWIAPLIVDGTDPVATFGVLPRAGAVRSFQLRLRAGQRLVVEYLIPDLAPENALSTTDLPRVAVHAPDCGVTVLTPNIRETHTNDDPPQNYLVLRRHDAPAVSGTYSIVITGKAPARFIVATGDEESEIFHGIMRGSIATDEQLVAWYDTPPRHQGRRG
jgi:hypothetical protein